ncbi:MAG: hypothetical protein PVG75_03405 [Thioalkalispiraceae bacterium]
MCEHAHRFCLADREGVACEQKDAHALCTMLLNNLRDNARFALKQTSIDEPLPHAKEMKVQMGGLLGLAQLLNKPSQPEEVDNIFALVQQAIATFGNLESLPYDEIARGIVQFQLRSRRRSKKQP